MGPGPILLSAHLLLQQFSQTGDGQVTLLVNTARHFLSADWGRRPLNTPPFVPRGELRLRNHLSKVRKLVT